jgi:hypothetical protein
MDLSGISLIVAGLILIVIGAATRPPERRAPKTWRFWIGTVVGAIGVSLASLGLLIVTDIR